MKVNVAFTLDIDPAEWEGRLEGEPQPVTLDEATTARIAAEAASHAESVVRDLYFDQGWIAEHHPAGHPDNDATSNFAIIHNDRGRLSRRNGMRERGGKA